MSAGRSAQPRAWQARQAQAHLRELRVALAPLATQLSVPRQLQLCAELLDETLGSLVTVLGQLEEYSDRRAVAGSVARMAAALAASSPSAIAQASMAPELASGLARLQELVR